MEKVKFSRPNCPNCPTRWAKNKGNLFEWRTGYELTGKPKAPNNTKGSIKGDVMGYQIKTYGATVHLDTDNCFAYIFGEPDGEYYYILTIAEMHEFVNNFSRETYDSETKKPTTRLKTTKIMVEWLNARA